MKNLLILLVLILSVNEIFAGGSLVRRKNCYGDIRSRYVTDARIYPTRTWQLCYKRNYSCNVNISSYCEQKNQQTQKLICNAYAQTGPTFSDYAVGNRIAYQSALYYNVGEDVSEIIPNNLTPYYEDMSNENEEEDLYNTCELLFDDIEFDDVNERLVIHDLSGGFISYSTDRANVYQVVYITVYDETNGDYETNPVVIYHAKAFIYNGELVTVGDFNESEFTDDTDEERVHVMYNLGDKIINLPPGTNLDNIAIKIDAHAGNLVMGVPEEHGIDFGLEKPASISEKILSEAKIEFNIIGNPAKEKVRFYFSNLKENSLTVNFDIVTMDGKVINTISNQEFGMNQNKTFEFDLQNLPSGNYLLRATTNSGKRYTQKLIKN